VEKSLAAITSVPLVKELRLTSLLVVLIAGCSDTGPLRVKVDGQVQVDGQPMPRGRISFVPIGGSVGPKAAGEIANGKYHLTRDDGPIVGRLRVEIYAADEVDYALDDPKAARRAGGKLLPPNAVPARYNRASELTVQTSEGNENRFDFELTLGITRP
jgi:hypothetical protein